MTIVTQGFGSLFRDLPTEGEEGGGPTVNVTVTTSNTSETTAATIPLTNNTVNTFGVLFVGEDQSTNTLLVREVIFCVVRQNGGGATQIDADKLGFNTVPAGWNATHEESGNNVLLQVTGSSNQVTWTVQAYQTSVSIA